MKNRASQYLKELAETDPAGFIELFLCAIKLSPELAISDNTQSVFDKVSALTKIIKYLEQQDRREEIAQLQQLIISMCNE